jgi:hypothetical protein
MTAATSTPARNFAANPMTGTGSISVPLFGSGS